MCLLPLLQVTGLQHLHKLSLPFPLSAAHLHNLSKLPHLVELLSFHSMELDVLGPAHEPLGAVTKLVTSSIDSHGKPLAALFPALQSVYLRSCGDMEALSLRSCGGGLSVLVAGDCGGLTDEGFASFRSLRGLTRLQMDNAHQVRLKWWQQHMLLCPPQRDDGLDVVALGQVLVCAHVAASPQVVQSPAQAPAGIAAAVNTVMMGFCVLLPHQLSVLYS